jgi:hypothetical protein
MKKVMSQLQEELAELDQEEMQQLVSHSRDEAVRIALELASLSPIQKKFHFDEKYQNVESLANLIDDMFLAQASRTAAPYEDPRDKYHSLDFREGVDDYGGSEKEESSKGEGDESEKERLEACQGWKSHYQVIEGVSWGNLPYDLQKKWQAYNCDVFLAMA